LRSREPEPQPLNPTPPASNIDGWLNTLDDLDSLLDTIEAPPSGRSLRERGRMIIEPALPLENAH
jgi:hypothetical protein